MDSNTIYSHPLPSNILFKTPIKIRKEGSYEPFVYIVQEKSTGKKYIGSRTAVGCKLTDIGSKYFTSSKYVNGTWKDDNDSFEVIEIFPCESNHSALILEEILIDENNAVFGDEYHNLCKSGVLFNRTGLKNSEYQSIKTKESNTGYVTVVCGETGVTLRCKTSDPNYISGYYIPKSKFSFTDEVKDKISKKQKGFFTAIDTKTEEKTRCSVYDPDYESGRYVGIRKGIKHSDLTKKKISESVKSIEYTQEKKDTISKKISEKKKNRIVVRNTETGDQFECSIDDPNYLSGLYVSLHLGSKRSQETKNKMSESAKGRKMSDVTKKKISDANKNKTCSDETKKKLSLANKGVKKPTSKCKFCGIVAGNHVISRWHNENCKHKGEED